jgi:hypothetical protein
MKDGTTAADKPADPAVQVTSAERRNDGTTIDVEAKTKS